MKLNHTLQSVATQLTRFSLVGVLNTGIDFLITNLLFIILAPESMLGLTLISIAACLVAAGNSYLINSRWTFNDQMAQPGQVRRFIVFAGLGLVVNTAVFLFVARYLPLVIELGELTNLNIAKLAGVICAMGVTFVGYRFGVFYSQSIANFRDEFRLSPSDNKPSYYHLAVIFALALAARLVFLAIAPVAYGDAVNYSWLAVQLASGDLSNSDPFWHSLYDFWQMPFAASGIGQYPAMVLSSLIPGILLILPVVLITRRLYGDTAGFIAGLVMALHPRLVEYSVNGYAEAFYLCGAVWALWGITALVQQQQQSRFLLAIGIGASCLFLVRNETLPLLLLVTLAGFFAAFKKWVHWQSIMLPLVILGLSTLAYVGATEAIWEQSGLFNKSSNLQKNALETLDMAAAAKETYGLSTTDSTMQNSLIQRAIGNWPGNMMYLIERLPGMLLSPIILLAILLPLVSAQRGKNRHDEWPLLLFSLWPVVFYPFIQLEPRMLFPLVIGMAIFGAAGMVALSSMIENALRNTGFNRVSRQLLPAGMLILLLPFVVMLAWNSEKNNGFHREIGYWLKNNTADDMPISGDGYGYISSSTFWAGRKGIPRPWTETPAALSKILLDRKIPLVLLYESYLQKANPQILDVLHNGLPEMTLIKEWQFERAGTVQAWQLTNDRRALSSGSE